MKEITPPSSSKSSNSIPTCALSIRAISSALSSVTLMPICQPTPSSGLTIAHCLSRFIFTDIGAGDGVYEQPKVSDPIGPEKSERLLIANNAHRKQSHCLIPV